MSANGATDGNSQVIKRREDDDQRQKVRDRGELEDKKQE